MYDTSSRERVLDTKSASVSLSLVVESGRSDTGTLWPRAGKQWRDAVLTLELGALLSG